ncbi:DNA polymerase sliding clamp [Halosimplex aquaticum]|uniref:DNA polymerase sliding clamp n=1 Tax=Halosimplex aquaticum TaxID=3026162 RepID=A0ABD5Y1I0_9EURY|nr:DNA polymerase sliding clamp [Halosimplex aquaticum]
MTPRQRQDRDDTDESTDEPNDGRPSDSTDGPAGAASGRALDVRLDAEALATALDGAMAVASECRMAFDDGLVFRARDPADVAMVEMRLDGEAFDRYAADGETFGVALDRLRDAVAMADGDGIELALGEGGRFDVNAGAVEYAFAPLAAESVRRVEWIDAGPADANAVIAAADLRRAVRAAGLVADHAVVTVDPSDRLLAVTASGDTDDVRLEFGEDDLEALDPGPGDSDPVESLYSVDYLRDIVGAIPDGVPVSAEFVGGGEGGCPLALEHPIADGDGTGRWLLAPRIRR